MIRNQPLFKYVFLGGDILVITCSFFFALQTTIPEFWEITCREAFFGVSHFLLYCIFLVIYLFCFLFNNLYKRDVIISRYRQFILILKSLLAGGITCVMVMVVANIDYLVLHGKSLIFFYSLSALFLLFVYRVLSAKMTLRFLIKKNIYQSRILIIGGDTAAKHTALALLNDSFSNFHLVGFVDDYKEEGAVILDGFRNLGTLAGLEDLLKTANVDEILIAIDNAPYSRLIHIVERCLQTGKVVRIYSDLLNIIAKKMKVENYATIPVIMLSQNPLDGYPWSVKRNIDFYLSLVALVLLSPVFLAIAVGIKLSSKGPVIFKQERIGKGGKPFSFYKFRSMHINSDASEHKEFVKDFIRKGKQCDNTKIKVFKITDDPRIFKFGRFIRKTSLDELPQLFNVLKGDMSLVAPRPCLAYEWECYDDWHKRRLDILPGCTGMWQALGRSTVSFEEMVILDLYYISNMSLWLDLKIVLHTFPVIFLGKGGF
ncbi:MAG: hypothetical protein A2521_08055 [Deltaproteobacteria bacterium RIFOXYD12_FULL_57_12]|nr:MAG: hypothetical protein A2521_08055 [Deltaproteobacteria bacterium RIFOXYD12_FULL_57_12]